MFKLDVFVTLGALAIAGIVFWGSEYRFNLIFFETSWFWFSIISLMIMETPIFLWLVSRNEIPFDDPE